MKRKCANGFFRRNSSLLGFNFVHPRPSVILFQQYSISLHQLWVRAQSNRSSFLTGVWETNRRTYLFLRCHGDGSYAELRSTSSRIQYPKSPKLWAHLTSSSSLHTQLWWIVLYMTECNRWVVIHETKKFRDHMAKKLSKRDLFEDSVDEIVGVCTEVSDNVLAFTHLSIEIILNCLSTSLWRSES